jgi:hypothetical protein
MYVMKVHSPVEEIGAAEAAPGERVKRKDTEGLVDSKGSYLTNI